MQIITSAQQLRAALHPHRLKSQSIGFVPTMGALHAGHIALVNAAKANDEVVVVSIFVNPKQFGPNEDFTTYPRQEQADLALLDAAGVNYVFMPSADEFYSRGFATSINVLGPALGLESDFRPHFFTGVVTVVAKLLCATLPNRAYFGEKDYQQLLVIKRLVADLNLPIDIIGCPTVREADGLAMSSRNTYLSTEHRAQAVALYATLRACAQAINARELPNDVIASKFTGLQAMGFSVDYLTLRDFDTLAPIPMDKPLHSPARLLIAARIAGTRLIDNIAVDVH